MNRITKGMVLLMAVGFMAVGPVAYAEQKADNPEGGKSFRHEEGKMFMAELNLTPEQKEKLKAQRETKREAGKALREQLKTKMQALHETISKPGTTRADVDGLVSEINALKGQMFSERIDGVFAMKQVLTPEQFEKMQTKRKEWMGKKSERHSGKNQEPPPQD